MTIEILATGPAARTNRGGVSRQNYDQTEQAVVEATYHIERSYQGAHPDIAHFFSDDPHTLAVEMMADTTTGGWDISGVSPEAWDVSVYADADAMLASAQQAETEQERPAEDILLEWAEYTRAPTNACVAAFETLTGEPAPAVGEA